MPREMGAASPFGAYGCGWNSSLGASWVGIPRSCFHHWLSSSHHPTTEPKIRAAATRPLREARKENRREGPCSPQKSSPRELEVDNGAEWIFHDMSAVFPSRREQRRRTNQGKMFAGWCIEPSGLSGFAFRCLCAPSPGLWGCGRCLTMIKREKCCCA